MLFLGAAVAVIALFLGLAAGPVSAGPDAGGPAPPGKSGDPGPKPSNGGEAEKKAGEGAKPGSAAHTGKKAAKRPHEATGPPSQGGGQHTGGPKASSDSHDEDADSDQHSPAGRPHQEKPAVTPPASAQSVPATTTSPLRDPDRAVRTLSSGTAGFTTGFASDPADAPEPAGAAPAAGAEAEAPSPPNTVVGGALDPPLLGAEPPASLWAPFVPALDEPAFPATLLAALALFLALFGRGDRRDPKLVEAVVDDRSQDVDFS